MPDQLNIVTSGDGVGTLFDNSTIELSVENTGDLAYVRPEASGYTSNGLGAGANVQLFPADRMFLLSCQFSLSSSQFSDGLEFRCGLNRGSFPATQSGEMGFLLKGASAGLYGYYYDAGAGSEAQVSLGSSLNTTNEINDLVIIGRNASSGAFLHFVLNGVLIGSVTPNTVASGTGWYRSAGFRATDLTSSTKFGRVFNLSWYMSPQPFTLS